MPTIVYCFDKLALKWVFVCRRKGKVALVLVALPSRACLMKIQHRTSKNCSAFESRKTFMFTIASASLFSLLSCLRNYYFEPLSALDSVTTFRLTIVL